MSFATLALARPRPARLGQVSLPRRQAKSYYASPVDWRDEVLYFLLVDRFSDGQEAGRPLLDRTNLAPARPAAAGGEPWRWDRWAQSGGERWQGGTLKGVTSKLGYLKQLGITAIWLSPVFTQRGHYDTYHGYGVQDFLDVDPRFGDRKDLVELVAAAHQTGIRVILDIIFNHSGNNWTYAGHEQGDPPYTSGRHAFGKWRGDQGQAIDSLGSGADGVWPQELQNPDCYTRAGAGNIAAEGGIDDPHAEHRRTDFDGMRDFNLDAPGGLGNLAACFKYWIALTDCDGFRLDTLKHVSKEQARNFCGSIKEFAANLGKTDFFLLGEIAGGDRFQDAYLDAAARNLNAALDIGSMRPVLEGVAKGLTHPSAYFNGFNPTDEDLMGSHRNLGTRHVSVLDDHDHVMGPNKLRVAANASCEHQVVAGVALQLLTLGIPCLYYGTEQALAGAPPEARPWLPDWDRSDKFLREALFGPRHPRGSGRAGLAGGPAGLDSGLPGFGPFGTAGRHGFDPQYHVYRRIAALAALRREYPALRYGRQYLRRIALLGWGYDFHGPGELIAWSRILDDEEVLCVLNAHGTESRGADATVEASFYGGGSALTVIHNSAQHAAGGGYAGTHPKDATVPVRWTADGRAFVELRGVGPAEIVVLTNRPVADAGAIGP